MFTVAYLLAPSLYTSFRHTCARWKLLYYSIKDYKTQNWRAGCQYKCVGLT